MQLFIIIKISLLAHPGAEPRQIQCIRLVVETENNTQNALEPEYDRKSLMLIV